MKLRESHLLITFCILTCSSLFSQNQPVTIQVDRTPLREPVNLMSGRTTLQICGLKPGKTYKVIANPAFPEVKASYKVHEVSSENPVSTFSQRPQLHRFKAESACSEVEVEISTPGAMAPVPSYISIGCVDCEAIPDRQKELVRDVAEAGNLNFTMGDNANDLVTNVLVGGDCFDVSGIKSTGATNSRGTFVNGQQSINISQGIVLATGYTTILRGPNLLPNIDGGFALGPYLDPELGTLSGVFNQYDVSVIEFDFKPSANTVQFDFVFGSDEYCEYVNSIFNDVFGFFISGPGIVGTQNLAVIPGTNTPIAINEVNHLKNSAYYRNNNNFIGVCQNQPVVNMNETELDGFTTVLTATANVIPCQTYHIKLAIADVGDDNYTSAVFLRANSFDAGGQALAMPVYPSTQPFTREGCSDGFVRFYRGAGDINQALTVNYSIDPASTATPGLDFDPLPSSVVIPAGQSEVLVPVNIVNDQITEGSEFFRLLLDNACSCDQQEVTFEIQDQVPLELNLDDQISCTDTVLLTPTITGGLAPLSYQWSNGQTTQNLSSTISGSTVYTVTVSDVCGLTSTVSATASLEMPPTANLSGDGYFCPGGSTPLSINFTGTGPWAVGINADGIQTTEVFTSNPAVYQISQAGNYSLESVISNAGCIGLANGSVTATEVDIALNLNEINPKCNGESGTIISSANTNFSPYTYLWNNGSNTSELIQVPPGSYSVTVTSLQGCTAVATASLTEPEILSVTASSLNIINCINSTASAEAIATGGTGMYQYLWSNGDQQSSANMTSGGTFTITVTDANACTASAEVLVAQDTVSPTAVATASAELNCNLTEVDLSSLGSSTGTNFKYTWSTTDGHIVTSMEAPSTMVDAIGTYTLLVSNTSNGCTASDQVLVTENTNYPQAMELQLIDPGCGDDNMGSVHVFSVEGGDEPYLFSIDGGNTYLNQSAFYNLSSGQYDLTVQDINGCEYTENFELEAPIETTVSIPPDISLHYGEAAEISALLNIPLNQLDTLIWSPMDGITFTNQTEIVLARPFVPTWYTVTAIAKNGCSDEASVFIQVDHPNIYVPNVLKPGSTDGKNHMFMIFSRENTIRQIINLQIFDRWGNMVFGRDHFQANDDRAGGWDGRFRGKVLEPGVFTWWAEIELASGEEIHMKGDVTIVD